ncbi:hypothetical protein DPMN_009123 [Dreissena polymorpha]|uniref:Uncharacterized protein n=1 Tax=Dreissena polymorpha TaxID=45954 RepID=A0A9D4RZV0_DREPO|nr:hypothetical protein DPMN_009123 [Dreissena polymorpha]
MAHVCARILIHPCETEEWNKIYSDSLTRLRELPLASHGRRKTTTGEAWYGPLRIAKAANRVFCGPCYLFAGKTNANNTSVASAMTGQGNIGKKIAATDLSILTI